ncbi:MAG: D-alanine--D-alanine ligase A, partial [Chloroflexi bacterium]|nr:D-alanine--D-alanine ligase A [Chloroflexota bacterium]
MTNKLKIGVLFGGRSVEHAVSLMSARFVLDMLDPTKYKVFQIGITPEGVWMVGDDALEAFMAENLSQLSPVTMLPDPTRQGLRSLDSKIDGEMLEHFADLDVLFPVLHGTFGEDGTLQGLFELAGSAYVGAGVVGSAVGMDKGIFKDVMRANDIPTVEAVLVLRSELNEDMDAAIVKAEEVGDYPLFVKPANLGSSVGISKAASRADLVEALMDAAQYDRRVVVQKGLNMRE